MDIKIIPKKLKGRLDALPSKSHAHRVLIAQKLARMQSAAGTAAANAGSSPCQVNMNDGHHCHAADCVHTEAASADNAHGSEIPTFSKDIEATKSCLAQLDCASPRLNCIESGSTMRFMLPVVMALRDEAVFIGTGKLPSRPISPLKEEMERNGCTFSPGTGISANSRSCCETDMHTVPGSSGTPAADTADIPDGFSEICTIRGRLQPGTYRLAGNVSSQFITGLLFALPLLDGDSTLELTTSLESAGYVDLTLDVLRDFGIMIDERRSPEGFNIYVINGSQRYTEPAAVTVQGDWSNAAFWLACGALGGDVTLDGVDLTSSQRDKEFADILMQMGAHLEVSTGGASADHEVSKTPDTVLCSASPAATGYTSAAGTSAAGGHSSIRCSGDRLCAVDIDAAQIPDLVPVLATVMALADGASEITHAERLRIKESDRIFTVHDFLSKLGADITDEGSGLSVRGKRTLPGGEVCGHNDHRIVMAAAVASCGCTGPVIIRGAEAVNKSYPDFFRDFAALGGEVYEL